MRTSSSTIPGSRSAALASGWRKAWRQIASQVAHTASGTGCRQRRDHRSHHADQDTGDASWVEPLLDQIDSPIGQFTADGADDGKPAYDAVTNHSACAAVVIPPRSNAGGTA